MTKQFQSTKHQTAAEAGQMSFVSVIVIWCFEIVWSLVLDAWCFLRAASGKSCKRLPSVSVRLPGVAVAKAGA
jgi:hypothetical protein